MPLSEDEQRILHEIERRFYEHDPEYAKSIESTTLVPVARPQLQVGRRSDSSPAS